MRHVASKQAKPPTAHVITPVVLKKAVFALDRMSDAQREQLADEIYLKQPNLLGSVVVQYHMGASMAQVEALLSMLLVAYQAMKVSARYWPLISDATQDICLRRLTDNLLSIEGRDPAARQRAINLHIEQHKEPYLLAFIYSQLRLHDMMVIRTDAEKYLVLAALNMVECIAETVSTDVSHSLRP